MTSSRSPKVWLIPVGVVGVVVLAFLAFGVFGVHTLFVDDKVDEAAPTFGGGDPAGADDDDSDDSAPSTQAETDVSTTALESARQVETLVEGDFSARSHPTEGRAFVLTDGNERVLRFEDFETDNGPDLNVYLTTASADASDGEFDDEFIDLGDLKGNIGDQNYEIPADVDLDRYSTVVIWCVRFSVPFGAADLA